MSVLRRVKHITFARVIFFTSFCCSFENWSMFCKKNRSPSLRFVRVLLIIHLKVGPRNSLRPSLSAIPAAKRSIWLEGSLYVLLNHARAQEFTISFRNMLKGSNLLYLLFSASISQQTFRYC